MSENQSGLIQTVSQAFIPEYAAATGRKLSFRGFGDSFPDAILCDEQGAELGAELVSVVFDWMRKEATDYQDYGEHLEDRLRTENCPQNLMVGFQEKWPNGVRPPRLPKLRSREGKSILAEMTAVVMRYHHEVSQFGSALLRKFAKDGKLEFPSLYRHFDAVFINVNPVLQGGPAVRMPTVIYNPIEIAKSVHHALATKLDPKKGSDYRSEILLLHTFPGDHTISVNGKEMARIGRFLVDALATEHGPHFDETWFLNFVTIDGQRLYRLDIPKAPSSLELAMSC